jgi:hypothetical protein
VFARESHPTCLNVERKTNVISERINTRKFTGLQLRKWRGSAILKSYYCQSQFTNSLIFWKAKESDPNSKDTGLQHAKGIWFQTKIPCDGSKG